MTEGSRKNGGCKSGIFLKCGGGGLGGPPGSVAPGLEALDSNHQLI